MRLDLTDEETFALLNLLVDTIEADRYPMSPRIRLLRAIVRKFGKVGGLSNDLEQKLRRYAPPPPAPRPTPEKRDPNRTPTARTATATLADWLTDPFFTTHQPFPRSILSCLR
jgi:hypothetical protein